MIVRINAVVEARSPFEKFVLLECPYAWLLCEKDLGNVQKLTKEGKFALHSKMGCGINNKVKPCRELPRASFDSQRADISLFFKVFAL